jgi:hypothetical protein
MASWQDNFKATVLSAKRWPRARHTGKILTVETVTVSDSQTKKDVDRFCVTVEGLELPLPLNKANCIRIAKKYGDDTDQWIGKKIEIVKEKVKFGTDDVDGLVVTPK